MVLRGPTGSSRHEPFYCPTVTLLGSGTFYGCDNLREVLLNEGLQKIKAYTFWCCTSLSSVTLPSTVTEIGQGAFQSCDNLREVVLHAGSPREIG